MTGQNKKLTYRDAGVDIDRADASISRLAALAKATQNDSVLSGIGGFGALYALGQFKDPVLVSGTDGVGTKLLLAIENDQYEGIGHDLVAMCANDILVSGARPLFFLDYFATGSLEPPVLERVVESIASGCKEIGCALVGGETAEMPGLYEKGHFDLAGFCVGVVERDQIIDGKSVQPGDAIVGIPSSGPHSNGYSLIRKILAENSDGDVDALMKPTRLYGPMIQDLLESDTPIKAMSHITGGGITENLTRAFPKGLGARVDTSRWQIPAIFEWMQNAGPVDVQEMFRTFNMGIGFCLVVQDAAAILEKIPEAILIGEVTNKPGVEFV